MQLCFETTSLSHNNSKELKNFTDLNTLDFTMIRPSTPDDTIALIAIADAIGFQPNELEQLSEMLRSST